jgi:hypothetical protein
MPIGKAEVLKLQLTEYALPLTTANMLRSEMDGPKLRVES